MAKGFSWNAKRVAVWAIGPGEDLVEEIYRLAKAEGVKSGVVMSAVGGLKRVAFINPQAASWPPEQREHVIDELVETVSIVGAIGEIGGEEVSPGSAFHHGGHLHACFADKEGNVHGGIIRSGCIVWWLVQVMVLVLEER